MRARMLVSGGFLVALAVISVSGCAAANNPANKSPASAAGCTTYAYGAIRARERLTAVPAACAALSPSQRNVAVGLAIRLASGSGSKSVWRRRARVAAAFVSALITGPAPVMSAPATGTGTGTGTGTIGRLPSPEESRIGFGEFTAQLAALLAWLATAGSGGWILIRWWRAGGSLARLRRRSDSTVPFGAVLGHVGLGLLGLVVWALFMITAWTALAWIAVGLLAPVAGLGMSVLIGGLPRPSPLASPARPGRQPVLAITLHGLFVLTVLLLVLLAAIGA